MCEAKGAITKTKTTSTKLVLTKTTLEPQSHVIATRNVHSHSVCSRRV